MALIDRQRINPRRLFLSTTGYGSFTPNDGTGVMKRKTEFQAPERVKAPRG
jgi:hypothetical protein